MTRGALRHLPGFRYGLSLPYRRILPLDVRVSVGSQVSQKSCDNLVPPAGVTGPIAGGNKEPHRGVGLLEWTYSFVSTSLSRCLRRRAPLLL
jgi:hypothetical protein